MDFGDVGSGPDIRMDVDRFLKEIKHIFSSVWTDENKKIIQDIIKDFLKESLQRETNTPATNYVYNTALVSDIIETNVTKERLKDYSPDFSVDDLLSMVNNEKYAVEKISGKLKWLPRKKRTQDEMEYHCEKLKDKLLRCFRNKLNIGPKINEMFYKPKGETLWVSLLKAQKEKETTRIQEGKKKNDARATLIRNSQKKASEVKEGANKLLTEVRDAE